MTLPAVQARDIEFLIQVRITGAKKTMKGRCKDEGSENQRHSEVIPLG